jgi:TonB family protein
MKKIPGGLAAALVVLICVGTLRAQDVTVSESQWFERKTPPDVFPVVKSRLKPVYPERLEASVSGYVILRQALDEKGKRVNQSMRSTLPEFEESVARAVPELTMKPAQTDGKPVASTAWLVVIFNAANASLKKPEARPRLLAVAPAVLSRPLPKNPGPIWANVSLDEKGGPQKFSLEDAANEEFREDLDEALKAWKFAPARKGGIAVAAETRVAFFVIAPTGRPAVARTTPPKPIRQVAPVYPPAMQRSGLVGEVVVGFEVDVKGNVSNATVVRSNNPGFEAAAVECVSHWRCGKESRWRRSSRCRLFSRSITGLRGGRRLR